VKNLSIKNRLKTALILTLAVLVAFEIYQLHASKSINADKYPENLEQAEQLWTKHIMQLGPEAAYEQFKYAYRNHNPNTQHELAHVMGSLFYTTQGTGGVIYCDGAFSYGCYHEFFGQAIHNDGLEVIDFLNKACIEKNPHAEVCQHGLGHGIGLDIHEAPRLNQTSQDDLTPGMVVTVEPGIYLARIGGVRIEDDVLVTKRGHRVLSRLGKGVSESVI